MIADRTAMSADEGRMQRQGAAARSYVGSAHSAILQPCRCRPDSSGLEAELLNSSETPKHAEPDQST